MAEQDLSELETDAGRVEDEELDEDNLLKPQFVDSVIDALDAHDHGRAYELVEPLHPADIADLSSCSSATSGASSPRRSPT